MPLARDDLGYPVPAPGPARRVVSLVPSLTESVAVTRARRPEVIVLPDEPYPFSADDGPEMFPCQRVALVNGRDLTWYGPSLVTARFRLAAQLEAARPALR